MSGVTRLIYTPVGGTPRVMNTITATSQFFSFKAPKDLHLEENRQKCAEMIRDGWIHNAYYDGKFEIIHGKDEWAEFQLSALTHEVGAKRFIPRKQRHVF